MVFGKVLGFEWGLDKRGTTALITNGANIYQIPIKTWASSGIFIAKIGKLTRGFLYDRSAVTTLRAERGPPKQVIQYDIADAMPLGTDATEMAKYMAEIGISDVILDVETIDFLRAITLANTKDGPDTFIKSMENYITSMPETDATLTHREKFRDITRHVAENTLYKPVQRLSNILDRRIVSPDAKPYTGLIPTISDREPQDIPSIKNVEYTAIKNWTIVAGVIILMVFLPILFYMLYDMGYLVFFERLIPQEGVSSLMQAMDPCSEAVLIQQYPDIVDLAVALEKRELHCDLLPSRLQVQLDNLEPEFVNWVLENGNISPPIMPPPEDLTLDDITITPEEAARQQAEADAAEQARLQAEQNAAEELRLQEEAAALERQARIDREAARVAEFERVQQCGDYDYIKSTYQTSFNIAVGLYTGELDCSLDELPEQYRDTVAAQDQRTVEDYVETGLDILNP